MQIAFGAWMLLVAGTVGGPVLQDGDRIVLVGDTLAERDASYSWSELATLQGSGAKDLIWRNIGWSGDTPAGLSRAYFDPPEVGFQRLVDQIKACQPTVVVFAFGMASLLERVPAEEFLASYRKLLDAVPSLRVCVILTPIHAGPAHVDPTAGQRAVLGEAYVEGLKALAAERNARFVDLWHEKLPQGTLEPNDLHLNSKGYRWFARHLIEKGFGIEVPSEVVVKEVKDSPFASGFRVMEAMIPGKESLALLLADNEHPVMIRVVGLSKGKWELGRWGTGHTATETDWGRGVAWSPTEEDIVSISGNSLLLIKRKNQLYFERYRPQNITYLLGFRAYEQGQNAKEIEALDPKVAELENEIRQSLDFNRIRWGQRGQ
jgi:lysophospholipase L1-like esterase